MLSNESKELADQLGGLNAHVAETAALAHDLGHPPFGHIAEERLDTLLRKHQVLDGFEGNAQSFRIVTKLAIRSDDCDGLNLTAASLAALLKYPWVRQTDGSKREHKWGAYHEEEADFKFARKCCAGPASERRSVEAEVMDWADDIAYSIYDLEDFYRAGMIPLERIFPQPPDELTANGPAQDSPPPLTDEAGEFLDRAFKTWAGEPDGNRNEKEYRETFQQMAGLLQFPGRYEGSKSQRAALRTMTSTLIRR